MKKISLVYVWSLRDSEILTIIRGIIDVFLATQAVREAQIAGFTALGVSSIVQGCVIAWSLFRGLFVLCKVACHLGRSQRSNVNDIFCATTGLALLYASPLCFIARLEILVSSRLHLWHASGAVNEVPRMASNQRRRRDCGVTLAQTMNQYLRIAPNMRFVVADAVGVKCSARSCT